MKGHLDVKELEAYKKADLQKLAREMGVSDAGTVKEIAARVAAVEVDAPDESELTDEEKKAAQEAEQEHEKTEQPEKLAAGEVKAQAVTRYLDKQLNQIKEAGEIFVVSRERADILTAAGFVEFTG